MTAISIHETRVLGHGATAKGRHLRVAWRNGQAQIEGRTSCTLGIANGIHARWHWDGEKLEISNCTMGFQPLFWKSDAESICVSEHLPDLVEANETLDETALAVFLRLGFFLGDDTAFVQIRQLPPNSKLSWRPARGADLNRGERPSAPAHAIERDRAIRIYGELFHRAVEKTLPAPEKGLFLPLTGGRDSRHIAYALKRLNVAPEAYVTQRHLPTRVDNDARIAAVLARELGSPLRVFGQPGFYVQNLLNNLSETGYCADEHGQLEPLRQWLKEVGARRVYDGIGGDVMSQSSYQNEQLNDRYRAGELHFVADALLERWRGSTGGWAALLHDDMRQAFSMEKARQRLRDELAMHASHHDPLRAFYFWNRTRREIALCFPPREGLDVCMPYLEEDIWHFLEGLPSDLRCDRRLHTDTILHTYPEWAHIPFEDKSDRRVPSRRESLRFAIDFLLRAMPLDSPAIDSSALMTRCMGLFFRRAWWSPEMALYLLSLLKKRQNGDL